MGRISVHEFVSLDGVIDTPTWTFGYGFPPPMRAAIAALMEPCGALLLGRTTFEGFAASWPDRTADDDPGAPFFNDSPKYVVSSSLSAPAWQHSHVVGPYDPDTIRRLKAETEGNLYVSGSGTLVRALLADGLVDELHLFLYPLTRGVGPRLFAEGAPAVTFPVATSESFDNGVTYLRCLAA